MTIEELLIPRVRCVSTDGGYHYPDSPFGPNEILVLRTDLFTFPAYCDDSSGQPNFIGQAEAEKYPHLFQPLKWWEERKIADISGCVKYLKFISMTSKKYVYVEVKTWKIGYYFGKEDQLIAGEFHCISEGYYEIATQAEWDAAATKEGYSVRVQL